MYKYQKIWNIWQSEKLYTATGEASNNTENIQNEFNCISIYCSILQYGMICNHCTLPQR